MTTKDLSITEHRDEDAEISTKRSPKWPGVEKNHLKIESACVACGSKNRLNVHHKKPFHLFPELELDPTNLITLCMDKDCHLKIGHGGNFKDYNPDVESDSKKVFTNKLLFESVVADAKRKRLEA